MSDTRASPPNAAQKDPKHVHDPKDKTSRSLHTTPTDASLAEEMASYGITRVPVDYYHFEAFRYTNLKDAVAQAKRRTKGGVGR